MVKHRRGDVSALRLFHADEQTSTRAVGTPPQFVVEALKCDEGNGFIADHLPSTVKRR